MSIMNRVQEILALHPNTTWNDLVKRQLDTVLNVNVGNVSDGWNLWLSSQGYVTGGLSDRMSQWWNVNNTPPNQRNTFYFAVPALFEAGGGSTVPGAPTIGTATAGNASAAVAFTAPASNGGRPILSYRATSTPGGLTATATTSPITVVGLTNGTAYTFTVSAQNINGFSAESAASNSVTPSA